MALDAKTDQNFVILGPRPTPLVRTSDPGGKSRQEIKNSLITNLSKFYSCSFLFCSFVLSYNNLQSFRDVLEAES